MQEGRNDSIGKMFTVKDIENSMAKLGVTKNSGRLHVITPEKRGNILDILRSARLMGKNDVLRLMVFYETSYDARRNVRSGHWCCMGIRGKDIYFFDSLGYFPDDEIEKINPEFRRISNQDDRIVGKILYHLAVKGYNIHYNDIKFQEEKRNVNTCGRYCALFLSLGLAARDPYRELAEILGEYKDKGERYFDDAIIRYYEERIK